MAEKYSVTPKGQFHWAHVSKPDTTFKAEGQFHIKLQLTGEEATSMKTLVDVAHAEWKKEVNKTKGQKNYQEFLPYKVVMDDEGMESGIQFHFKLRASGVNSRTGQAFTQRPMVVGPDKTPLPSNLRIGNGSSGKVSYEIAPYQHGSTLGVQLRLRAVQVLELIEFDPDRNANGDGSDVFSVEKGYEVKIDFENTKEEADIFPPEGTKDEALSTDF